MCNELLDLIKKEVEFKITNKIAFDEVSSEAKSSSESLNTISNTISSRTYSRDRLHFSTFSPHSSSNFSNKSIFSARKKDLKILPIRNLMNQQKSKEKNRKKKDIGNIKIKFTKGPGRYYSITINEK